MDSIPPSSGAARRGARRTPTNIARKNRFSEDAVPEERIEITDPLLERHALRVGWELDARIGTRSGRPIRYVVARAIYRLLTEEDEDGETIFELTVRKRPTGRQARP